MLCSTQATTVKLTTELRTGTELHQPGLHSNSDAEKEVVCSFGDVKSAVVDAEGKSIPACKVILRAGCDRIGNAWDDGFMEHIHGLPGCGKGAD
eukprot:637769-Pelagomonas_calceolata.AAC.5